MRSFTCHQCRQPVFFENYHCANCGANLGFVPAALEMFAFDRRSTTDLQSGAWPPAEGLTGAALRPCANRLLRGLCNWMLDEDDAQTLCRSCRLTRVIPSLDAAVNIDRWQRIERAKRRLLFTLLSLGLAPEPKTGADDTLGLEFLLLEPVADGAAVFTGHDAGTITLNVAEADDDVREATRVQLGEPARTLLGHLRHEVAHYLQFRWIAGTPAMDRCRSLFGDEQADYAQAIHRHYTVGPPQDWAQHFVSAYASAHPWEDWAETCAHYLLVLDAVQSASAWGLSLAGGPAEAAPDTVDLTQHAPVSELVVQQWLPVAQFLNAMNRSIGLPDSYPYQLPPDVVTKMAGVHELLAAAIAAESAADVAADADMAPTDADPRLPVLQAGAQCADRVLDAPRLQ